MHAYENYKTYGAVEDGIERKIAEQPFLDQISPERLLGLHVKQLKNRLGETCSRNTGKFASGIRASSCTECEGRAAECDPPQTSRVWSSKPNK